MLYFKIADENYIYAIGIGAGHTQITGQEYESISNVLSTKPTNLGQSAMLRTDLTWALFPTPPLPQEESTAEDYEAALNLLGVET